jgi:hypothetical protein
VTSPGGEGREMVGFRAEEEEFDYVDISLTPLNFQISSCCCTPTSEYCDELSIQIRDELVCDSQSIYTASPTLAGQHLLHITPRSWGTKTPLGFHVLACRSRKEEEPGLVNPSQCMMSSAPRPVRESHEQNKDHSSKLVDTILDRFAA